MYILYMPIGTEQEPKLAFGHVGVRYIYEPLY